MRVGDIHTYVPHRCSWYGGANTLKIIGCVCPILQPIVAPSLLEYL